MFERMTADQIERVAEKAMDILDRKLLSGKLTQADYDAEVAKLARWTNEQYGRGIT